ncbi:hypothetical protein [Actinoplanes regularis]|uniref:hypothetical protein n=1 Tax=Actinoplanes regularis TaxID=52697 RepID=UPI0024A34AC0|nr:hypothetical protein [Actinoplanes regularis]GLW27514.1 DNA-binding protein [Actinoplanes regularis]
MSGKLLDAGAILPGPPTDAGQDVMTARCYRHPVLDGRTTVRLVGATVGPAEDLSMEFLGFTGAVMPVEVGHGRRLALGFPAWALVHDPANGRHALALVKEMEKLARMARHKPGNARDGYGELAERLGAAAPQLLPTFWEQAGRAFLAAENQRMAGSCFTEARRAEQVHGLAVDEDRVRDVHLEFALAGGLTATMLAAYAREVVARRPPAEAYELVRNLSLRRVAGGLPPHVSMAADLARLARAAGRNPDREAEEVVALLLTYPATARSHPSVWKSLRKILIRLGKRDATVRARLLEISPEPPGWRTDVREQWLELLEATGAAADLTSPAPGAVSAGRWLERFLKLHGEGRNARLIALVERMTDRLRAEGGVRISGYTLGVDLDVLDVCRAAGVPVDIGDVRRAHGFKVDEWADDEGPGRRDLAAVAADPQLRPLLRAGVRSALGKLRDDGSLTSAPMPAELMMAAFGAAGVRAVLAELIGDLTGQAGTSTVAGLHKILIELAPLWSSTAIEFAPDAFGLLTGVDMPAVLARTLRAGQLAELTWPAYERAAQRLQQIDVGVAWPELVLHDERSAQVISPDGQVAEHVFRFDWAGRRYAPNRWWSRFGCLFADGELLVYWHGDNGQVGYWSSRPDDLIEGEWQFHPAQGWWRPPLPVPGGGSTTGSLPMHAGDARIVSPEGYGVAGDGQAFWRREPVDPDAPHWRRELRWREFDPRTGQGGRVSLPAFFAAAGDGLDPDYSSLRPVPAEFADSPLGVRDGLAGWRVTRSPEGVPTAEGIDGRTAATLIGPHRTPGETPIGAVSLPGSTAALPVTLPNSTVRVWTADGAHLLDEQKISTGTLPPFAWWHAMRARDEAGSAALRSLDEDTAAALLTVDDAVTGAKALREAVTANLVAHLPGITDATLRARVAEVVTQVVRMRRRIAEISRQLGRRPRRDLPRITDNALTTAWDGLGDLEPAHYRSMPGEQCLFLEQIVAVGEWLARPDGADPVQIPSVGATWASLLAGLGAVALRAASPATSDEDRTALAGLLATIAGTPLDGEAAPLRIVRVDQDGMVDGAVDWHRDGTRLTVVFPPEGYHHSYNPGGRWQRDVIQLAPDGVFTLPPSPVLYERESVRPSGRLAGERLRAFLTLLAERGPAPWRPSSAEALAEATGMTRAEAVLLLAGLPGVARWEATFLSTEQRRLLGLTGPHATLGREAVQGLSHRERVALLDAAMPTDPVALWEHGPDVAAIAEKWIALRGRRVAVPEELVAGLARVVDRSLAPALLRAVAAPAPGDCLTTDGPAPDGTVPFDADHLPAAAIALPWLAYQLTWDDPLRAALPEALRLVRERLRNPNLRVGEGWYRVAARPDAGPALVDTYNYDGHVTVSLVPAELSGLDDPAIGLVDDETAVALRILLSTSIEEAVATPEGASGDPRDPRICLPTLVDEVRERYRLDGDAAAYYLQLLALPDPADKAVRAWNGWTSTELRRAQQALIDAGLVVTAKRERAGRPVFLPGGWQAARAPHLPVETWKLAMYQELDRVRLVVSSLPLLFRTAWGRITDGDVPRYHDLEENR